MAILFPLIALVTGDVLAAQIAKLIAPTIGSYDDAERAFRVQSDVYHHGLKPNVEAWSRWGPYVFRIKTNSLGFKDRVIRNVPPRTKARRVLVLGDSFTEGLGFAHERTFVGRVSAALSTRGVEVLNAGVGSYSPSIYYAKTKYLLERVGLQVDEAVVFLDVSDIHDEGVFYHLTEDDRVVDAPGAPKGGIGAVMAGLNPDRNTRLKAFLKENSAILRLGDIIKDRVWATDWRTISNGDDWLRAAISSPRTAWTSNERLWRAFGQRGLESAANAMRKLAGLLQARSIPLTVVVYPWPSQILRPAGNDRHVAFWRSWSEAQGIQFVDLFPRFIGHRPARDVLHDYYIPVDNHWNEAGHAYVARCFLEAYRPRAHARP